MTSLYTRPRQNHFLLVQSLFEFGDWVSLDAPCYFVQQASFSREGPSTHVTFTAWSLHAQDTSEIRPQVVPSEGTTERTPKQGYLAMDQLFRSFVAPNLGRASVPAESVGAGLFRHIICTKGMTATPSRRSPRARQFTDLLSVGVGCISAYIRVAVFDSKRDSLFLVGE